MLQEKNFVQHGDLSCYEHSLHVAERSLRLADLFHVQVDRRSLVRGALLHDYFLYDWHHRHPSHRGHARKHANRALRNAVRDFPLNDIERDIIAKHMFPLNLKPPRYRESILVCLADKLCTLQEILSHAVTGGKRSQRSGS